MDNPVFTQDILENLTFYKPTYFFEGVVEKTSFEEVVLDVYVANLPQKEKLNYVTSGSVGVDTKMLVVLQPSANQVGELTVNSEFEYLKKRYFILESQDWNFHGGYFRYIAALRSNVLEASE